MVCVTRGLVIADRLFNEQTERDAINCFFRCLCIVFPRIQFLCASSMPFFVQSPKISISISSVDLTSPEGNLGGVYCSISIPPSSPPWLTSLTPFRYISVSVAHRTKKLPSFLPFDSEKKNFQNTSCSKIARSTVHKPSSSRISPSTSS